VTFLLDVNVLIALIDSKHAWHDIAHDWFGREGMNDWATCPLVENGIVRIVGRQAYPNFLGAPGSVVELLRELRGVGRHAFWPDEISLLDSELVIADRLTAPGQVTDTYLLALAVARKGKLATFDRRLSPVAVKGGSASLHLIG
jgi:hypothetical protein